MPGDGLLMEVVCLFRRAPIVTLSEAGHRPCQGLPPMGKPYRKSVQRTGKSSATSRDPTIAWTKRPAEADQNRAEQLRIRESPTVKAC